VVRYPDTTGKILKYELKYIWDEILVRCPPFVTYYGEAFGEYDTTGHP
jgi:hypothetical protein